MQNLIASVSVLCLVFALSACPGCGDNHAAGKVTLEGAVQKGPFLVQSSIQVSVLDGELNPTGTVYNTETINDLGEFTIQFRASGAVSVEGSGYYYNEVQGGLSASTLTLRAFYVPDTTGTQNAYVNMITHLTTGRVKALVTGGMAFADAVAQAELELMQELDIIAPGYSPSTAGVRMNVTGEDNDDNAYLLAVSAVLTKVAIDRFGSVEGNVQSVLNEISSGFVGGTLSQGIKDEISASLPWVNTAQIMANLGAYLSGKGHTDPVPDMDRVIDQDRDGLANSEDNCPRDANPGQEDDDNDGVGNACDLCPATACPAQCLPATANPSLTEDLCYTECESQTAGPCQTGFCMNTPYLDTQTDQPIHLCAEACNPLDAAPCASGSFCGHRPKAFATDIQPGVYACLPEVLEGPGGLGSRCYPGFVDQSGAVSTSESCQGSLYCGQIEVVEVEGTFYVCRLPCDPASPGVCGAESCQALTSPLPAGLPGLCEIPPGSIGYPCTTGSCQEGLACSPSNVGGCTFYHYACCQPAGSEGEICYDDDSCDTGLGCLNDPACGSLRQCCLPAGGLDQRCFEDRSCSEGFRCFYALDYACPGSLTQCCLPEGGEGDYCYQDLSCNAGLFCASLVTNPLAFPICILAGGLDEPCGAGNYCDLGLSCAIGSTGCAPDYEIEGCCQ